MMQRGINAPKKTQEQVGGTEFSRVNLRRVYVERIMEKGGAWKIRKKKKD